MIVRDEDWDAAKARSMQNAYVGKDYAETPKALVHQPKPGADLHMVGMAIMLLIGSVIGFGLGWLLHGLLHHG